MRNAFAKEITRLAGEDERIVLLSGDIGNRLFDAFKERFPDRFYNCGVAEANMIGVAAGLAKSGFRPVCYTITPFVTYRCLEQIRVDLCYHKLPVVIVGTGSGLSYASLGATHHSCEEMGMLRLLPGMHVYAPADAVEVRAILGASLRGEAPAYLRIGKKGEPEIHPEGVLSFLPGEAFPLRRGKRVCFLSCGTVASVVLDAADRIFAGTGEGVSVWSCPSVKPLDVGFLGQVFRENELVVTVEEHSRLGGFGGAVAEWLSEQKGPCARLLRIGTPDEFYHEIGSQEEARCHFGLTGEAIAGRVMAGDDA